MSKTFVVGDIHGAHIPLRQCLERSGFDRAKDTLITLGDIVDGWPYVYECVEELLTIKNRIDIIGNHDAWFNCFIHSGFHPDSWRQGGAGTTVSYLRNTGLLSEYGEDRWLKPDDIPEHHKAFFRKQLPFYKDAKKRVFVHAGFYKFLTLKQQLEYNPEVLYWDRELWAEAVATRFDEVLDCKEDCSEIYIGHTHCIYRNLMHLALPGDEPLFAPKKAAVVYNLDTGAGSHGKLTIMDVDTKEYWQSDIVNTFYGEYKPR